ncbi:uncharacterized protein VTP21DRAFT_1634 [Calcarisporiella thermophila]|uniref:uncharacterized protein n=1 Tax=Calcarisporiella thermophila TaxID=911321 RepID=UPI00374365A2
MITLVSRKEIFLAFWLILHALLFICGFFKQKLDPELSRLNDIGLSVLISRGAGLALSLDLSLILLPMCRTLIRFLRSRFGQWVDFDENVWFHKVVAWTMCFFALVHAAAHYVNFATLEQLGRAKAIELHYSSWGGTTGNLMLLLMVLMYTTSVQSVRSTSYETFWYTHHFSLLFILCALLHAKGCFVHTDDGKCRGYNSWVGIVVGYCIYIGERVMREIRATQTTYFAEAIAHPWDVIELRIKKPNLRFRPGQYIFLNMPAISRWQWHPFTITSSPDEEYLSVHMRLVGDWTRAVGELLGYGTPSFLAGSERCILSHSDGILPELLIDGPFGAPAEDVFSNEIVVLIGAGIGVTPFASILKHIWIRYKQGQLFKLQRVELIWIYRNMQAFEWFHKLLQSMEEAFSRLDFLRVHIHLTARVLDESMCELLLGDDLADSELLPTRTNYGHPDFNHVFKQIKLEVAQQDHFLNNPRKRVKIGVFYCGPPRLAHKVRSECQAASTRDIQFNFFKEEF